MEHHPARTCYRVHQNKVFPFPFEKLEKGMVFLFDPAAAFGDINIAKSAAEERDGVVYVDAYEVARADRPRLHTCSHCRAPVEIFETEEDGIISQWPWGERHTCLTE